MLVFWESDWQWPVKNLHESFQTCQRSNGATKRRACLTGTQVDVTKAEICTNNTVQLTWQCDWQVYSSRNERITQHVSHRIGVVSIRDLYVMFIMIKVDSFMPCGCFYCRWWHNNYLYPVNIKLMCLTCDLKSDDCEILHAILMLYLCIFLAFPENDSTNLCNHRPVLNLT